MTAPRPPRRPLPASLRPPTAWLVSLYLQADADGFRAWMTANRRRLPVEDQMAVEDDLADLAYVAGWYRHHLASDVGHADHAGSDMPRRSGHDDSEITTAQAAEVLGMSPRQVLRLVEQRVLVGRKVNARATMITRASVAALRAARAA